MQFPLGKPVLMMIVLSLVGAAGLLLTTDARRARLEVWAFGEAEVASWRDLASTYQARTGQTVDVREVSTRAIDTRLLSLFMSGQRGAAVPDVVAIEIGSAGKYFRPPADQVGLLPLEGYLRRDGLDDAFVKSRLAPWSKGGHVFGLPLDVHPVSITYRRDLYEQAGVDLASAKTWEEFRQRALAYQAYWQVHGHPERAAIELPESSADVLYMMLLQRGVNVVDERNRVHIDDPKVADTMAFYARLVAGPEQIGQGAGANPATRIRALVDGDVGATVTPDWGVAAIREWGPELAGKLAMTPLPRFDPGDYPTSTWGGTMAGIPRNCADPERAWQLVKFLTTSPDALHGRRRQGTMLPATPASWDDPRFHEPDPFFGGQRVGELYVDLARQLPPRYVTPFTTMATGELSLVLHHAVRAAAQGETYDPLRQDCRRWLDAARGDLERYIRFGEFE